MKIIFNSYSSPPLIRSHLQKPLLLSPPFRCTEKVNTTKLSIYEATFSLQTNTLVFYSASSLRQQSTDRHVAPLWQIILISSKPVFALSPEHCVLSGEATNTNFIFCGLTRPTALEASMMTITPPMTMSHIVH